MQPRSTPPGSAGRATALTIVLVALGFGALLMWVLAVGFWEPRSDAIRDGWLPLAITVVCWTLAAWNEIHTRGDALGDAPRRPAAPLRAVSCAVVALVSPALTVASINRIGLPAPLALAAAAALFCAIGVVPLRWLLRP